MRKNFLRIALLLPCCLLLTSCWDEVTLQDLHYITALGIDYKTESKQFEAFAHIVDVSAAAKKENGTDGKAVSFVGHAEGPTPNLALDELFRTMQMEPNVDHLMTLIVSESAAPRMQDVLDSLNRSRAVRYTVNLMGTSSEIPDLFQVSELVSKSPLNTDIYQPNSNKYSKAFHNHWDLQKMVRTFTKGTGTAFIPNLDIGTPHWMSSSRQIKLPYFNGAFVIEGKRYIGKFSEEELSGARWFHGAIKDYTFPIRRDGQTIGTAVVQKAKGRVRYIRQGGGAFDLRLSVQFSVRELIDSASNRELEKLAAEEIRSEIETTREIARSRGADLFGLEETLYRFRLADWKRMQKEKTAIEKLPVRASVTVHLITTGKLKSKLY